MKVIGKTNSYLMMPEENMKSMVTVTILFSRVEQSLNTT